MLMLMRPKLLDTVTNIKPIARRLTLVETEYQSALPKRKVGTIVEVYDKDRKAYYLVEFANTQGHEYAMAILTADEITIYDELRMA